MTTRMSGQEIYENFINGNTHGLAAISGFAHEIARCYETRVRVLSDLTKLTKEAWQGDAADAARRKADPLMDSYEGAFPLARYAGQSMYRQVVAFEIARSRVIPVRPIPEKPGFFDNVFDLGNASGDYETQVAAFQSENNHNIAVMAQYEETTQANRDILVPIPAALAPPSPPSTPGSTANQATPAGNDGQTSSGGVSHDDAGAVSSHQPQFSGGSAAADVERVQARGESVQAVSSGGTSSAISSRTATRAPSLDRSMSGHALGPVGTGYELGADRAGGGVPGSFRRSEAVDGPRGSGTANGSGSGARGGGAGGMGTRGPSGVESPGGRGAAGRAGASSSSGPLGGGRRGESGEDVMHQRPVFLVEADPDELFGNNEAAAPPVIGG